MESIEWLGLAGPTAAGKSALALAIARAWPVEIVSVDSALVYRCMDIGTAKPSAAERAEVPHHLLDLIEPEERYSAARFVADARRLVREIRARGRWPLLVGGTMMYFKALADGLDALPAADAGVRAEIDAQAAARGWPALHAELARVDPATAARLAPHDAQRIQRALEVHRVSGVPLSAFHTRQAREARAPLDRSREARAPLDCSREARAHLDRSREARAPLDHGCDAGAPSDRARDAGTATDHALIALEPDSRGWLHARVAARFEAMLAAGFLDEVRALRRRPALASDMPSMRSVGYRQAWEALEAADPPGLDLLRERAVAATRQLAKRQLTWLRGMPGRESIAADAPDVESRLMDRVAQRLGPPGTPATR